MCQILGRTQVPNKKTNFKIGDKNVIFVNLHSKGLDIFMAEIGGVLHIEFCLIRSSFFYALFIYS